MSVTITRPVAPPARVIDWLDRQGLDYELREHEPAFTALETAREEGVDPVTFAKVIAVTADGGRLALMVLDAVDRLDMHKARRVLGGGVRLLTEPELASLSPDCQVGAIPAIGPLYDIPTYADIAMRDVRQVSFKAGTHNHDVRLERRAWERHVGVTYVDIAEAPNSRYGFIPLYDLFVEG